MAADILDFATRKRDREGNILVGANDEPVKIYRVEVQRFVETRSSCIIKDLPIDIEDTEIESVAADLIDCAISMYMDVSLRARADLPNDHVVAMVRVTAGKKVTITLTDNDPPADQYKWVARLIDKAKELISGGLNVKEKVS